MTFFRSGKASTAALAVARSVCAPSSAALVLLPPMLMLPSAVSRMSQTERTSSGQRSAYQNLLTHSALRPILQPSLTKTGNEFCSSEHQSAQPRNAVFFRASYCCAFYGGNGREASACRVPLVPVCKPCHLPPPRFAARRGLTATKGGSYA